MKINENGVVRDMTPEEEQEYLEMTKDDPKPNETETDKLIEEVE